jgi:transposase, IS5 family
MKEQVGFFDVDERLRRLTDLGDQLEAYAATVDFEIFRYPWKWRWPMRLV